MAEKEEAVKKDPKIDFFNFDLKADKLQPVFSEIYLKNSGNWSAIKAELKNKEDFNEPVIKNLEFTYHLADWSGNNPALVSLFQQDEKIHALRDIALTLNKSALIDKVKTAIPNGTKAAQQSYAVQLHHQLFLLEPTAILVNMVKDPEVPMLNDAVGANVAAVLDKQPDFNIKTMSIYKLLDNSELFKDISPDFQSTVATQLKTLQRIASVSPVADAIPVLYNAKLHTALQISELPKAQFIAALSDSDLDNATLEQVHSNAEQARVRNEQFLMKIREAAQPTGIAMIDKSLGIKAHPQADNLKAVGAEVSADGPRLDEYAEKLIAEHHLSWDLLFGDADFCECGECNSVYSPAAYYVELLSYLRNNNLDPDAEGATKINPDPKDISNTPLEKLFNRRPDLGCLELTCQNTNTLIPYVDLVNEVMESYVAFKHLIPFNVDDEISSELLAEAQHTEYQAYSILKDEVYPFTLPYHQPIDAARIYLTFLETSRHELIDTFRKNNAGADAELTRLQDEALDRAADAEFLKMTLEEYVILTKEGFESIELTRKLSGDLALTLETYRESIGVKPVHQYYGYESDEAMLGDNGLTQIKREFLRRTGIDYFNLVDLLKTETINPCMPRGKSKAIMESLHYSYRFLQKYAEANGIEKMADDLVDLETLAELSPSLKGGVQSLLGTEVSECESLPKGLSISDQDILCWVKHHFEQVGKMIVIENGLGCVDGQVFVSERTITRVSSPNTQKATLAIRNCKIFIFLKLEKEVGSVDHKTGKISIDPAFKNSIDFQNNFSRLIFIGNKGEKGRFIAIEGEIYLIFLEQRDSCDLDTAVLQHLDGTPLTVDEYDRIHRFLRLWRKLGWTIDEVDKAIVSSGEPKSIIETEDGECGEWVKDICNQTFEITPLLMHQLVAVRRLFDFTGLELIKLLSFWSTIATSGENPLYQRLFLTHNLLGIDKVFKADGNGNFLTGDAKMSEHLPVVMAAFSLTVDDIQTIKLATGMDDQLSLENLTVLYRYRLLAKVLGLRVSAFVRVLPLFGDVFKDAHATLEFLESWAKVENTEFIHQQLSFIINDIDDDRKPFSPDRKAVIALSKTLYDGLNVIDESHRELMPDPSISDEKEKIVNVQQQATSELVRTKASLVFESEMVDRIMAYLEGTSIFSTNAPKGLEFELPENASLKVKFKYDKNNGAIQIVGQLTETERADFLELSADPEWELALTRIKNQQKRLYNEVFAGIIANSKSLSEIEKTDFKNILTEGDIEIPFERIEEGHDDPNTAPKKRVVFLKIFLPYLRQELIHRFIVTTISNFAGIETKVAELLLTEILTIDSTPTPVLLYDIFEQIKDSSQPAGDEWSGYLIPAADALYTFIVKNTSDHPSVRFDGSDLTFNAQEDPTNEWWSHEIALQTGKLYQVFIGGGTALNNLFWKKTASAIAAVPTTVLIPDFASQNLQPALNVLKKVGMLISGFDLSLDELRYFTDHADDFGGLNFNAFTLDHWLRLESYTRLRDSLPQTALNILDFWNWVIDSSSDPSHLESKVSQLSLWNPERIKQLISEGHFNIHELSDYRNEQNLLKLQKTIILADKIGMDIDSLFDWAKPTSQFDLCRTVAESIKNSIRARYLQSDWEQVVKPLHDELRNHQRDALTAYLLQQPELIEWNVRDADGLFEYFLIDIQMDACMETSRIKQAISSVQLFVQRCFLGLEEEHSGITSDNLDRKRWHWVQRFRVWEANRKLYPNPENWIASNLRDDRSPFFKELESELLQKDITKENVTDALKAYLYKVDEVANMEVVGLHIEMLVDSEGIITDEPIKLHIFSRTRNAPYIFYYRYFDMKEKNWYPWEKMQVDIPSYDAVNRDSQEVIGNSCYLSPVVWNGRLVIFFPQIMKKSRPKPGSLTGNFRDFGERGINESKPEEFYEIKMAWSEYRNGKWTQKQISSDAVISDPIDTVTDIQYFKFVPILYLEKVLINVDDNLDSDTGPEYYNGAFEFDGTGLKKVESVVTKAIPIHHFNQQKIDDVERLYSWQLKKTPSGISEPITSIYAYEENHNEQLQGLNVYDTRFHYPNTSKLLGKLNLGQLESLFKENLKMHPFDFGRFDSDGDGSFDSYHELKSAYALYNWELFFHTPVMLAIELSKAQHFEEAMKWFHYVFNPMAGGTEDNRFWQFKPFKDLDSKSILDATFHFLKPNISNDAITEWRNKPFMPHVVARNRPKPYMKWVVMKYIENLLAYGDYLLRQDTIETNNQATQVFVLAGHILGPRPMMIPKRGNIKPQTYMTLLDKWDAFGNAMVEMELAVPFSNQTNLPIGTVNDEWVFANIFGVASSLYFCIPNNPKLMDYWDTVTDRLFKIRHCLNIDGVFRKLALFEPPIDTDLLVKAASQGLSVASVLNDLNTPMPNYRFYYLLQKALELCNELKSLGNSMLSAIEKKDNEALALIRAKHESVMQNLVMEIKKKQLTEAQRNIESLQQNRKNPEERMKYYLKLAGLDESLVPGDTADFNGIPNEIVTVDGDSGLKLIPFEKEDMEKAEQAAIWQTSAGEIERMASLLNVIPSFSGHVQPLGPGVSMSFGGSNLGSAASANARGIQTYSNNLTFQSSQSGKKGSFTRALQERIFQANAAGYELKQIDKQITAQQIRAEIANQEITNQQKAIDNANETEEFLRNKYTNVELYFWMRETLKVLYYQVYKLTFDLYKKAVKTYCFERGISDANFIQLGCFDPSREGLLAGEQLYVALKQLEAAHQEERGYDYEITKHLSLFQLDPLAVVQLRETGSCEFSIPEVLFDIDFPGHYKRRIKSVSFSLPCIVGPYTGVNATLKLLDNKLRNTSIGGKTYEERVEEADDRFDAYLIPIKAVAVSSGQNDSGVFELNFKDERYIPFEGAGVISKWRLELPKIKQYDYQTISDFVVHLRYTANEGGERLKLAAEQSVTQQLKNLQQALNETGLHFAFNMKHDLPKDWHMLKRNGSVDMKIDQSRLPYMFQVLDKPKIEEVILLAEVKDYPHSYSVTIGEMTVDLTKINNKFKLCWGRADGINVNEAFNLGVEPGEIDKLENLVFILKYAYEPPSV